MERRGIALFINQGMHIMLSLGVLIHHAWWMLLLCLTLSSYTLHAQYNTTIRGVVSARGTFIPRASVVLLSPQDSSVLSYTYTDQVGRFELVTNKKRFSHQAILRVRCLGYKIYTQVLTPSTSSLEIELSEDTRQLQEVIVQAPTVWGSRDSINYSVAKLATAGDRSLGDVIRRIPGMRTQGGKIEYQGKPIKQINIEGIDLSQGNYALLTSNIDASDIATIQVFDNHQSIRSLQGRQSSDDVVLNLKLSPKKRGVLGAVLDLGVGYGDGLETNTRLRGNYFSRKSQILGVAYIDNTGRANYQRQDNSSPPEEDIAVLARVSRPSSPHLPTYYYLDNLSQHSSANTAWVLPDSSHLKLQASYRYDKLHSLGTSLTTYDQVQSPLLFDETIQYDSKRNRVGAGLIYEKNLQHYYLQEQLRLNISQSNVNGNTNLNKAIYPQLQYLRNLQLENQVHYINTKTHLPIEVILRQSFKRLGEDFSAFDNNHLMGGVANLGSTLATEQKGQFLSLRSENRIQIPSIKLKAHWLYKPQVLVFYQYQTLSSSNLLVSSGSSYDHTLRLGTEQTLSYLRGKQSIDLTLPLSYQVRKTSHDHLAGLLFEPRLKIKLNLNSYWGIDFSGHYVYREPSIENWYPYSVLRDYRTQTKGTPMLFRERMAKVDGRLNYRNIFSFLTSSLRVDYSLGCKPFIQMFHLSGIEGQYELLAHSHSTQTLSSLWSISKGFTTWGLGLDFDLGYVYHNGLSAYQGRIAPYYQDAVSTRVALKASPQKAILIDYSLYYRYNKVNSLGKYLQKDHLLSQTMRVGLALGKHLFGDIILEHSHISTAEQKKDIALLNAELSWRKSGWELSCELNNLLNTQYYHSLRQLSYATIQQSYRLRPRSILMKISFKL